MFVVHDVVKVYWNAYLKILYVFVKAWDEALQYRIGTLHGVLLEVLIIALQETLELENPWNSAVDLTFDSFKAGFI